MKTKNILFLILLFSSAIAHAQFIMSAEVRPRTEYRDGFKTPASDNTDAAFFTEQRSRINFDFKDEKYKFKFSLQDVRIWGENAQIFKQENGNTYISEAWGQYLFNDKLSLKIGRQIISYDNQRILGGLEWAQQGRRHDAFVFQNENAEKNSKLHIGIAFNSDDDVAEPAYIQSPGASFYSVAGNYKSMQYLWYNKKFQNTNLSLLAMNTVSQNAIDSTTSAKQTIGFNGSSKLKDLTIGGDVYYQFGKIGNNDVSAMLVGLNLTYKTALTPLKLGFEYISGKDDSDTGGDTKITNFSPDFGTNHAHNGFMDYFFVGPANGNVGVTDIYLKTKFKAGKGSLTANFHQFMTGSTQLDASGQELSKAMGVEVDLVYGVKLAPTVSFNLGFSQMYGTDTIIALRPGNSKVNYWGWMMFTFKPTFIKGE